MEMMELSADPYELKLYQMFQSCDSKHCGYLDEESLRRLCALLELRDNGIVLIANLSGVDDKQLRVTFNEFREALLNFLGTEMDDAANNKQTDGICTERCLHINGNKDNEKEQSVDEQSEMSDSEQKLIDKSLVNAGCKAYGRRSKPSNNQRSLTTTNALASDESDDTNDDDVTNSTDQSHRGCYLSCRVHRSASQADIFSVHQQRNNCMDKKLKRCASLPAQRNLQNKTKLKSTCNRNKFGQQQQQQQQKEGQHNGNSNSLGALNLVETIPMDSILDLWTRSQIPNGRNILLALGFEDDDDVNLPQLHKVMDEEMRGLDNDHQFTLMRASLVLYTMELTALRQSLRQLYDENTKLRADNKDANCRIALFTAEIDERHASLEDATRKEIRLLEQKHAAVVRDLTARLANDRENWTMLNNRLENRIKTMELNDQKTKAVLESLRKDNVNLETEQLKLQNEIADLLEKNTSLIRELTDLEEQTKSKLIADDMQTVEPDRDDEEVLRLLDKISALQKENTHLRDKNDELSAEMEVLCLEVNKLRYRNKKLLAAEKNISNEITFFDDKTFTRSPEQSINTSEKSTTDNESSSLHETNLSSTTFTHEVCSISGEWLPLKSELCSTQQIQFFEAEMKLLKQKICKLEEQLKLAEKQKDEKKDKQETKAVASSDERCKDLENCLEQMRKAYEECEDYWQTKLSEERDLFQKERQIYEEEQHDNDKKFTELLEKVREYEEQYNRNVRLPPIVENQLLEQQYADLEAESEKLRQHARQVYEEKTTEITRLQNEIEQLRIRLCRSEELNSCNSCKSCQLQLHQADLEPSKITPSPSSSPISYLWHQSSLQEPTKKNCQQSLETLPSLVKSIPPNRAFMRNQNLTTSETTVVSLMPQHNYSTYSMPMGGSSTNNSLKDQSLQSGNADHLLPDCETLSTASGRSYGSSGRLSTKSAPQPRDMRAATASPNPNPKSLARPIHGMNKDQLKRLKFFEMSLRESVKHLSIQRESLIMELQRLHEAKPILEKAYARSTHPTVLQRVNQLELKNRHLQNVIKQEQQYTETLMQETWRQHQIDLNDLHNRLEAQNLLIAEQVQRLQNADLLIKDLYMENSHLTASVQRLEQQRIRFNIVQQQQQQQQQQHLLQQQRQSRSKLPPGMP